MPLPSSTFLGIPWPPSYKHAPYMAIWAALMHTSWGVALMINPTVGALAILVGLHWVSALTPDGLIFGASDGVVLGVLLIGVSLAAAASLVFGGRLSKRWGLCLLLPQQFMLMSALFSDTQTIVTGMVTGQTQPIDRLLLFTVLFPVMIAAVLHTAWLVERHSGWRAQ